MALSNGVAPDAGQRAQTRQMTTKRIVPALPLPFGQAKRKIISDQNLPKPDIPAPTPSEELLLPLETKDTSPPPVSEQQVPEVPPPVAEAVVKPAPPKADAEDLNNFVQPEDQRDAKDGQVKDDDPATKVEQVTDGEFGSKTFSWPHRDQLISFRTPKPVLTRNEAHSPAASPEAVPVPTITSPVNHGANELPPPFHPSNPTSTVSVPSVDRTLKSSATGAPTSRPSMHGLVFGGHGDPTAPAPMLSQPPHIPLQHFSGPPHPASTPFIPNGHAYHVSEPHPSFPPPYGGPQGYHPMREPDMYTSMNHSRQYYPPPPGRFYNQSRRHDQNFSPRYQHAPMLQAPPYHMPPPAFVPRHMDHTNGPPKAVHHEAMRSGPMDDQRFRQQSITHSDGPQSFEQKPPVHEDPAPLLRYLSSQFGHAEFADYVLQLSHTLYQFTPSSLPAHGLILARSPKLRSLMAMPHRESQNDLKVLQVPVSDRFLNCDYALIRGIMRLYGEPLPERQEVLRLATPFVSLEGGSLEQAQMRFSLALAAAGHFLQIDEIISHGLSLVGHILNWNTLAKALAFALEGGLSTSFTQSEGSSKDKESNSSFDGSPTKPDSPAAAPAYGFYSDRLLNIIVSFLVHNVPMSFKFSANAAQLNDPPRLPMEAEPQSKHTRSASRLSQIRFGDMTIGESYAPDPVTETISSILVSLPFPLLKMFAESNVIGDRLSWTRVGELMRAVVQEREQRRQRATSMGRPGADDDMWRAVRFVESVEPSENQPGFRMIRSLAATVTPPSTNSGQS